MSDHAITAQRTSRLQAVNMSSELVFVDTSIALTSGARIGQAYAPAILGMAGKRAFRGLSDALVLQEIADWAPSPIFSAFWGFMERILPVTAEDLCRAHDLMIQYPHCSPRVCTHVAVMQRHGIRQIYAVGNAGFEHFTDLRLLPLAGVSQP
ncbi:MAG: hypothetical protein MI924_04345 [Chloroflexales bacterium]|nr:hypothetical protein [Chloroflexales bacterium]